MLSFTITGISCSSCNKYTTKHLITIAVLIGMYMNELLQRMRPQVATGHRFVANAYGSVLVSAWLDAQEEGDDNCSAKRMSVTARELHSHDSPTSSVKKSSKSSSFVDADNVCDRIEDQLQALLKEAIHSSNAKYAKGLRYFFQGISGESRRISGVDSMLMRVYGPIIWRSLKAANAVVRLQGSILFFDVFPLQDPSSRAEDDDSVQQKQFDLLSVLLRDVDHKVRATAVDGVYNILKNYWESLPSAVIQQLLQYILFTLGNDTGSANVRLSVYQGLAGLFVQPLAHELLKKLLILQKNAIHDTSEKVRAAFVHVLLQVFLLYPT